MVDKPYKRTNALFITYVKIPEAAGLWDERFVTLFSATRVKKWPPPVQNITLLFDIATRIIVCSC